MGHGFEFLAALALGSDLGNGGAGSSAHFEVWILQRVDEDVVCLADGLPAGQPAECPNRHAFDLRLVRPRGRLLIRLLPKVLNEVVDAHSCFRHTDAANRCDDDFLHLGILLLDQLGAQRLHNSFADGLPVGLLCFGERLVCSFRNDACVLDELGLHAVDVKVL